MVIMKSCCASSGVSWCQLAATLLTLCLMSESGSAISFEEFIGYPFNEANGYSVFPRGIDLVRGVPIPVPFPYFGRIYSYAHIDDSGYISLINTNLSNISALLAYTPFYPHDFPLNSSNTIISGIDWSAVVAPYWYDIATSSSLSGLIYYKNVTRGTDTDLIREIDHLATSHLCGFTTIWALIVTWDRVGFYLPRQADELNTFQVVLATNGWRSIAFFNYAENGINWWGGAVVGLNAGDNDRHFKLPGSLSEDIQYIDNTTGNTGRQGQWVFLLGAAVCPVTYPEQYYVAEDAGTVEVCLMVDGDCFGNFSVLLEIDTSDGTATDSKDYMGGPFAVTFAPEENITCAYISIINDAIYEGDENFFIDIVALSEAMLTLGGRVSVTIQDDDTDIVCSSTNYSVTVDESHGSILLGITISREVAVPFMCEVETQPISANEEDDFKPMSLNITFEPEEPTIQTVLLEIVNDNTTEAPEFLQVIIQDVNRQQAPVSINITIIDEVPTAPLDLLATDISTSGFNLEWNPPSSPNGNIGFYQVVLFADNNPDLPALNPVYISGTSYTVTGLVPFTEYSVRVCAYTTDCGDFANLSVRTLGVPPRVSPSDGMTSKAINTGYPVTISFNIVNELVPNITREGIQWVFMGSGGTVNLSCASTSKYSFSDDCLSLTVNNTVGSDAGLYQITITTEAGMGMSAVGLSVSGERLAPPTELTVLELSPTSFTVSWRPPLGEVGNGSTLYYLVNVTDTEEESVVLLQHTVNSTVLQLRVAELLPNHVHQVSVAAVSGEETGPAVTVWIKTSAVTAAGTLADSINTVTVSTLGGLLGLLLLVVVVAVIVGTCTGLCVRHRRQSKATSEDTKHNAAQLQMVEMRPNPVYGDVDYAEGQRILCTKSVIEELPFIY